MPPFDPVQLNALVFSYAGAAAVCVAVAVAAWRRGDVPGAHHLALLMTAVAWWLGANTLEAASIDRSAKIAWSVVAYPGIESVPVLLLLFALRWTHQDGWVTPRRVAVLAVVPLVSVGMAATNEVHHLLWSSVTLVDAWGVTAVYAHGPWFWVELAYAYVLVAAAFGALALAVHRHPAFYSPRVRAAMVASAVPIAASIAYAFGFDASVHADLSSLAFALAGVSAGWGILRTRILDPVPVAWAALVDRLPDGVLVLGPELRLAACNPSAAEMLSIAPNALGRPIAEILGRFPAILRLASEERAAEVELVAGEPDAAGDATASDGSMPDPRWLNVRLSAIEDARGHDLGRLLVVRDVSERRRMVETIRRLSLTDELTGLLNRRGFTTLAEQQLRTSARTGQRLWLLFADVDGLKGINDRFGHETGDQALTDIARLLGSGLFRAADIVARFGGDEFAILATETGPTDGRELTERIDTAFREANADPERSFGLAVSVGSAVFDPARPESLDELMREADRRMYEAKHTRRSRRVQPAAVADAVSPSPPASGSV